METHPTDTAEGKRVVDASGKKIGTLRSIREGTAYVDPDSGLTASTRSTFGWEDLYRDIYPVDADRIEEVSEDEVRISGPGPDLDG